MAKWLDKYEQGGLVLKKKTKDNYGKQSNYNDAKASVGPDFVGLGYNTKGRDYSPAWGGRFAMGGALPGAVGFMYARTQDPAPSNGKYAKKTKASAQNGSVIKDDRGQWAYPGEVTEIGSNNITMQGVDYPVLGISDTGDTQMMQPGEDYKFDGEKVTEYPMAKNGGWLDKFDEKAQEGKDIPKGYTLPTVTVTSRRFNKYPYISNDNILSSKQLASEFKKREQAKGEIANRKRLANIETVRSYDPEKEDESLLSRAYHIAVNPMTALSYKVKGKDIPDHFERGEKNILEYATNVINPFSLVDAAASIPGNIKRGEFLQAGLNAVSILPAAAEFRGASYKNIYNYNPYAEKLIGKTQRQIFGDPAYKSFLESGPTPTPNVNQAAQLEDWRRLKGEASPVTVTATGETMQVAGTTRFDNSGMRIDADYPYAYFSEGSPWYQGKGREVLTRDNGVERILVPKEGANLELYPAGETSIVMNPEELTKQTINSYAGRRRVLSPFGEAFNPEAFDVYKGKPHWWKGYQKEAPPINKNKIDAVTNVKPSWKLQELPGLHISATMEGGPISKIIEPKTGLINVDQALTIIGKESGGASKVDMIKQSLGKDIPKKMDYNDFRKTVQDQLIPLDREVVNTFRSAYNIDRLGYTKTSAAGKDIILNRINNTREEILKFETKGTPEGWEDYFKRIKEDLETDLKEYSNLPLENQTIRLSNRSKFGKGADTHGNPEETLGHIHFLRDAESPDVLTMTQLQSDAFQSTNRTMPKSKEAAEFSLSRMKEHEEALKNMYSKARPAPEKGLDIYDNPNWYELPDGKLISKEELSDPLTQKRLNELRQIELENFSQKSLLDKNHQERYLQELVDYAGKRGDINKIRVPTSETAAKVQGYRPTTTSSKVFEEYNKLKGTPEYEQMIANTPDADKVRLEKILKGDIKGDIYDLSNETILKKYSEQPKIIKKVFGVEPKTVKDSKGNSWYEFDIPAKFKGGKGEIKAFKDGGWLNKYK